MESLTKTHLTEEQIARLCGRAFKTKNLTSSKEFTSGFFSAVYAVFFEDGSKAVLKTAPSVPGTTMIYEKNLMYAEVYSMKKAASVSGVPVPKVLYYDRSLEIAPCECFFMEYLSGVPFSAVENKITAEQRYKIMSGLGAIVSRVNDTDEGYFGYISQESRRFRYWDEALIALVHDILSDAMVKHVNFGRSYAAITDMFTSHAQLLRGVDKPSLLHKDISVNNFFVNPETLEITGIIDWERAISGDRLMEPVCAFLLDDPGFMRGFNGGIPLCRDEKMKAALYYLYLCLLMVTECFFRGFNGSTEEWARAELAKAFAGYDALF